MLRTSVLATWADVVMGTAAGWAIGPRIPLTGDLEVHLLGTARPGQHAAGRGIDRQGRSDGDGLPVAILR